MTMTTVVRATIVGGQLYVAIDQETNAVVGTACWFPPGSDFLATDEKYVQLLPKLSGVTNKYLGKNAEQNYKMENWTLYSLSVAPKYQGKGISRLLVKVGEDKVCINLNRKEDNDYL
ncbi:hypothetical protein BDQ17DRAFT_1357374 [Cyathus striatus]|nr:hypothetical protein BDQ17DRAFT_1357374 [Cyathus striatus]